MSEQAQNPNEDEAGSDVNSVSELEALKNRAAVLGISHHVSIGVDALRKKVNDKLNGVVETTVIEEPKVVATVAPTNPVVREKSKTEKDADLRKVIVGDAMALVRCKIYNLNPTKRDLRGEIITVANKFIGKVSKFIPFGEETENGYHLPKVLYDDLVGRQYQDVRSKEVNGKTVITRRMAPEYNIVVMPALTADELHELALKQAAAERMGA